MVTMAAKETKSDQNGPVADGQLDGLKSSTQSADFWETFMELKTNQKHRSRTESGERVTEQRISIMKQKAKKLEKRATRCGFCPRGAKRSQLVSFLRALQETFVQDLFQCTWLGSPV